MMKCALAFVLIHREIKKSMTELEGRLALYPLSQLMSVTCIWFFSIPNSYTSLFSFLPLLLYPDVHWFLYIHAYENMLVFFLFWDCMTLFNIYSQSVHFPETFVITFLFRAK